MAKDLNYIFKHSYIIPNDGSRLLRDWEDFGPKNLPEYFDNGYKIFQKKFICLKNRVCYLKTYMFLKKKTMKK